MTTDAEFEARVQVMVSEAVESVGAPDRQRLASLERRLIATAPSGRPWRWIVAAAGLVAAGAMAAYWGWQQPDSQPGRDEVPDVIEGSIGDGGGRDNKEEDTVEPGKHGQSAGNSGAVDRIIYIGQ